MSFLRATAVTMLLAIAVVAVIYALSLLPFGSRDISPLENIAGVPYARSAGSIVVLERLTHADVYLHQPVFGQQLNLTVTFIPHASQKLAVGVRENSFWLSYNPVTIYDGPGTDKEITTSVSIPLTDKLQDADQSLDLMFFATSAGQAPQGFPGDAKSDVTNWEIKSVSASTTHSWPTAAQVKDYLRSIIKRERAL